jgi:hypothetical protein
MMPRVPVSQEGVYACLQIPSALRAHIYLVHIRTFMSHDGINPTQVGGEGVILISGFRS